MKSQKLSNPLQPDLTIVIPAYNEEKRIGASLDELAIFLKQDSFFSHKSIEVLVVAADAPDRTREIVIAKQKSFEHLRLLEPGPRVGKGRDLQFGMLLATGKLIVFMDADLATPLYHLGQFYTACIENNDIVIGTRDLLHYRPERIRCMFAFLGNRLYRLVGGVQVEDTQCGFKMFTQRASKVCFSKLTIMEWGFDVELLAIAKINKLKIKAYRINDWKDMPYSTYKEGMLRITGRSVRDFVWILENRTRGKYVQ